MFDQCKAPAYCLLGRRAPHFGLRASAKATGHLGAHLDDALSPRHGERLCISIGDDKFDALQPGRDHGVDGIAARAALSPSSARRRMASAAHARGLKL